jgi:hypothetical protein
VFADNPFSEHAADLVASRRPTPLTGPILTRAKARTFYAEAVSEIAACADVETLDCYLIAIDAELHQFRTELPFLWAGDGDDFIGLEGVIAAARDRIALDADADAIRAGDFSAEYQPWDSPMSTQSKDKNQ